VVGPAFWRGCSFNWARFAKRFPAVGVQMAPGAGLIPRAVLSPADSDRHGHSDARSRGVPGVLDR
jgi:hypothetical protein